MVLYHSRQNFKGNTMKKILLSLSAILGIYSGGWCATATFTPTLNPDTIALEITQRKVLAALEGGGTTGTASSVSINGGNVGITGTVVVHQDGSPTATPNPTQVQQMIATLQAQTTSIAGKVEGILNAVATATPNVNIISMPGVAFAVTPDINVHGNISINTQIPTPTGSATPTNTPTTIQPVYVVPSTSTPTGSATPTFTSTTVSQVHIVQDTPTPTGSATLTPTSTTVMMAALVGPSRSYSAAVSVVITGSLTNAIIYSLFNPSSSGVTMQIDEIALYSNVQNMSFSVDNGTGPCTVQANTTPIPVTILSADISTASSAAVTGYVNVQPTPPAATKHLFYGYNGATYQPVLWPMSSSVYRKPVLLRPGQQIYIWIPGTASTGVLYGHVGYSEL
jgi:hypothetical protein